MSATTVILRLTLGELLSALGLPEGTEIGLLPQRVEDVIEGTLSFALTHNDLPYHADGALPRTMTLREVFRYIGDDPSPTTFFAGLSPEGFASAAKLGIVEGK